MGLWLFGSELWPDPRRVGLSHRRLGAIAQLSPFGPAFVLLAVALTLSTTTELITRRSLAHWYERIWQSRVTFAIIGLYVLYYGLRLWVRYAPPTLPWGLGETALWQQFFAGAIAL